MTYRIAVAGACCHRLRFLTRQAYYSVFPMHSQRCLPSGLLFLKVCGRSWENIGPEISNELLGQPTGELTQTGAIGFVVAGTANLETFADVYEIFSMP